MLQEIALIETARCPRTHGCASGNEFGHEPNCRNFVQCRSQIPHKSAAIPQHGANSTVSFDKSGVPDSIRMVEWRREGLPGACVPNARCPVFGAGHHPTSVRTEVDTKNL